MHDLEANPSVQWITSCKPHRFRGSLIFYHSISRDSNQFRDQSILITLCLFEMQNPFGILF